MSISTLYATEPIVHDPRLVRLYLQQTMPVTQNWAQLCFGLPALMASQRPFRLFGGTEVRLQARSVAAPPPPALWQGLFEMDQGVVRPVAAPVHGR